MTNFNEEMESVFLIHLHQFYPIIFFLADIDQLNQTFFQIIIDNVMKQYFVLLIFIEIFRLVSLVFLYNH